MEFAFGIFTCQSNGILMDFFQITYFQKATTVGIYLVPSAVNTRHARILSFTTV